MSNRVRQPHGYTRREFSRIALGVPAAMSVGVFGTALEAAAIDSRIRGVQVGAITYSFRALTDAQSIVRAMVSMGLGEVELMSNHAEALAGAPVGPNNVEAVSAWRKRASADTWAAVRRVFDNAGIELRSLCYNMNVKTMSDSDIAYGLSMAKQLGVKVMSTSTQVSMAKRVAPLADRHQMIVAFHGHANVQEPDEVSTPQSFATCLSVLEVSRGQSRHRPLHRGGVRRGRVSARAARAHHAPALERSANTGARRCQCRLGRRRHAHRRSAAAAQSRKVGHPGQYRVRISWRPDGRSPEVSRILQARARLT